MPLTGSFTFGGATITVQKPTVMTRVRVWKLRQSLREFGAGNVPMDIADDLCYYLANTVSAEGSLGFTVPVGSPTHDELIAFLTAFTEADELLVSLWDGAISDLKHATNEPDLLPPDELGEKKEPTPASSSSD